MKNFFSKNLKKYLPVGMITIAGALSLMAATNAPHLAIQSQHTSLVMPFDPDVSMVVSARTYSKEESKLFLGHNLIRKDVQPILIEIENNTANQYSLCHSSVDLDLIEPKKVAEKILYESIPRSIALKVASLFFWPIMIPSTIDGIYIYASHRKLKADYLAKSLKKEGELVAPYSTFYRIVFVPKEDVQNQFDITLINIESFQKTTLKVSVIKMDQLIACEDEAEDEELNLTKSH